MPFRAINRLQKLTQPLARSFALEERQQVFGQISLVLERIEVGTWLDKKVERIDDCHVRDQINCDVELANVLRKDDPSLEVAVRILLPVDEVIRRLDL